MTILAIDTAHAAVSVCVSSPQGAVLAQSTEGMARGHAEALLPAVQRVMSQAGVDFSDLKRIAVIVGPGSFTGIRIGIAAARAIGLACGAPVIGVSSLAALAAPVIRPAEKGIIVAAIDAKHGQVYAQGFSGRGEVVLQAQAMPVREAVDALGGGPLRFVGSGGPMMAIEAWSRGLEAEVEGDALSPDIAYVAKLGLLAEPRQAPARPYYLKPPDAKPQSGAVVTRAQ